MKKIIKISSVVMLVALVCGSIMMFSSFKSKKSSSGTVTITNKYWNNMHLQVRIGNNSVPENNNLVFDGNLPRGQSRTFNFDVLMWYRRDANPDNPNGNFSSWTQCFSSHNIDNP